MARGQEVSPKPSNWGGGAAGRPLPCPRGGGSVRHLPVALPGFSVALGGNPVIAEQFVPINLTPWEATLLIITKSSAVP